MAYRSFTICGAMVLTIAGITLMKKIAVASFMKSHVEEVTISASQGPGAVMDTLTVTIVPMKKIVANVNQTSSNVQIILVFHCQLDVMAKQIALMEAQMKMVVSVLMRTTLFV